MNRIITLDIAKAICIILVVIGHYIPDNSPTWYYLLNKAIYSFHMPLFMFASGYIYIATKKNIRYSDFIIKKIKRLMLPYFVTSVIIITIKLLTQGNMSVDNPVTYFSYIRMLYYPEAGYFLWFIWALWWMFVFVPLFKSEKSRVVLFILSIVLHFIPIELPEEFCINSFANMFVYFMFGILAYENTYLYNFLKTLDWKKVTASLFLFITCESLYIQNTTMYTGGGNFLIINILLPFIGIWFIIEISKVICYIWKGINDNWLMIVSLSSYIIYLFHTTFEGLAKAIIRKLPIDNDVWYIFVPEVIVVVSVGVIMPILLHRYVLSKFKLTRLLFGL